MKNALVCFLFMAAAVFSRAADDFPKPVKLDFKLEPVEMSLSRLPKGLRERLAADPDGLFKGEDGKLVKKLDVLACDLNADGKPEYLIWDPASYTGGAMIHIFASAESDFAPIGAVQGEFYFAKPVNGYYQIVYTARAGGASYERRLETFMEKRGYADTRAAEYRLDDNGRLVFVKDLPVSGK